MFIEFKDDLTEDYADKAVPEGEYRLRISDANDGRNKKDTADQTEVRLIVEDPDYPNAGMVFHYLTCPSDEDDSRQRRAKMRNITTFLKLFNVPFESKGFNSEDLVGQSADGVLLVQSEYEGRVSNKLRI